MTAPIKSNIPSIIDRALNSKTARQTWNMRAIKRTLAIFLAFGVGIKVGISLNPEIGTKHIFLKFCKGVLRANLIHKSEFGESL
mmetsp:Transcript_11387/g.15929  ORF Transcript_11387/g.15929 Transcript_11387/m.15929 type:complete len:84 (-) Transcript_11387:84-335(-)